MGGRRGVSPHAASCVHHHRPDGPAAGHAGRHPGVSAQATDEHPAIGAWILDATPADATDPLELLTIAPGGIVVSASPQGTGYGSWAATGQSGARTPPS